MFRILFYYDFLGGGLENKAEESRDVKILKSSLKAGGLDLNKFQIISTIHPEEIRSRIYDVCIFDFGGLTCGGMSGLVGSITRLLIKAIQDCPGRLFIAWTSFTSTALEENIEEELGSYNNLLCIETKFHIKDLEMYDVIKKINEWCGIEKFK